MDDDRLVHSLEQASGAGIQRARIGSMQLLGALTAVIVGSLSLGAVPVGSLLVGTAAAGQPARGEPVARGVSLATGAAAIPTYRAPLTGTVRVVTQFRPPATRYGPGHLGVDLAAGNRTPVFAAAAGVVGFAGAVAGRGVIVLVHADGISTEYEPVSTAVRKGQQVTSGQLLGRVQGTHHACQPVLCLHWGARRGAQYLDPLSLLRALGVVRLIPWDQPVGR